MKNLVPVTVAKGVAVTESGQAVHVKPITGFLYNNRQVYEATSKAFPWQAEDVTAADLHAAWLLSKGE